ncbi:Clp protease N-terminal domain-containing protein [Streptomyces sp. TRM 70361]|uniref:Clp protease N-terminal domain-containing protein n=1 Tax=Streptomyces sp. TRM 70361 TaxID=3116553 RepID=UPI002E7C2021|nr:Clp protease N-terminal domain-containing protein [Streptomyces sp. TRM 70361]MEE1941018.1 Clp protease N-terminal domain-containing protein [Streptomyces sp. TRM 70361]
MLERFTREARAVVVGAQEEARELGHGWIGTEHLLLAVLRRPDEPGAATLARLGLDAGAVRTAAERLTDHGGDGVDEADAEVLRALGIDLAEVRRRAEDAFGPGALDRLAEPPDERDGKRSVLPFRRGGRDRRNRRNRRHLRFTPRASKSLELSLREALALKDRHIGVEHLVLGVLRSGDRLVGEVSARLGLEPEAVRTRVIDDLRRAA